MKKLSVITVTYNAVETLDRTIASVKEQSYEEIEHIIVDGNSSDGTLSLIKKHEREKLTWISEPDKGLYDAMNKGIALATGDYLCFLNAGDTFYSVETIKLMFKSIDNLPYGFPEIIYGETAIVNNKGSFLHMRRLSTPIKLTWESFKQGMVVCHQSFIVSKEMAEPYDLKYRFSSDFDWSIRMLQKANNIFNTGIILINYLNEGMTTANRKASLKERYHIMVKHYGHLSTFIHHLWFVVRAVIK